MTSAPGQRLLAFLGELQASTSWTVVPTIDSATASRWRLAGSTWEATVIVDHARWIGLEFDVRDPVTGRRASYGIDTDLYDIGQEQHRDFANSIERDIVDFLDNLRNGKVLRGNDGSRFVLVIPRDGAYVRVVRGRFVTTSTAPRGLAERPGDEYVPVV